MHAGFAKVVQTGNQRNLCFIDSLKIKSEAEFLVSS